MKVFFLFSTLFLYTNVQAYTLCAKEIKQAVALVRSLESGKKVSAQDIALGVLRDGGFFSENQKDIDQYVQKLNGKSEERKGFLQQRLQSLNDKYQVLEIDIKKWSEISSKNKIRMEDLQEAESQWARLEKDPKNKDFAKMQITETKSSVQGLKKQEKDLTANLTRLQKEQSELDKKIFETESELSKYKRSHLFIYDPQNLDLVKKFAKSSSAQVALDEIADTDSFLERSKKVHSLQVEMGWNDRKKVILSLLLQRDDSQTGLYSSMDLGQDIHKREQRRINIKNGPNRGDYIAILIDEKNSCKVSFMDHEKQTALSAGFLKQHYNLYYPENDRIGLKKIGQPNKYLMKVPSKKLEESGSK